MYFKQEISNETIAHANSQTTAADKTVGDGVLDLKAEVALQNAYAKDGSGCSRIIYDLSNYYLQHNVYPDDWHVEANILMITLEDTTARLNQASLLVSTKTGTVNEIRELAGVEGVSDDELEKLMHEWKILEADVSAVLFTPQKEEE